MEQLLIWSLKSSAILAIVFACYYFLFRNNTVFKLRRALLLLILALSCLAPLFEIQISQEEQPVIIQQAAQLKSSTIGQIKLTPTKETAIQPHALPEEQAKTIDWRSVILYAYLIGIAASLALLLFELGKVIYLKFTGSRAPEMGRNVIVHSSITSPFSFNKTIFIPKDHDFSGTTWKTISIHEQAHIDKRHSLDLLFARLVQSLFWFNPIIYLLQKDLRTVHEAQADEEVLKNIGFSAYAQTLMQVSLPGYQLPVAHSFAVISSFSKRLKLMKTHRTKLKTTLLSIVAISLFSFGIIGWSSLKGQEEAITGRTESFEKAQTRFKSMIPLLISNKLTPKHQKIMEVIKTENPDKEIRFQYYKESSFKSYYDNFIPQRHPLFTSIMSQSDKEALTRIYLTDSTIINMSENIGMGSDDFTFKYSDFTPDVSDAIKNNVNYIMIYEYIDKPTVYNDSEILNLEEVDQAPIVMGGIENLAKTIALDIKVPEHLDRNKLPENIEFEFVVQGGKSITHINLLNNLKGSDKKNKPYYQFFREVHDDFRMKISSIYPWKRGIKDGKEVLVRMKISIPTKYML
ncbi:MAG: M56 family metallopeptidase [Roseivirga sp.]|uniref:M56 family metallopeptidase n=1 Tax=Roseivirga sp. TaxID=1964215 RepID=UPI001B02293C|nr:M56 family metallopeptidase [Roseivirga sp.]MBO6661846.1 M56 family metallopeptidase [Roseivirga sp.]MBO6908169.1 M56 family metallopeptidase [Roseivirga sp.]